MMMGVWECFGQRSEDCLHSTLRYDEVASSGPAAQPLDFPTPTVFRCERVDVRAMDHKSGTIHKLRNVIVGSGGDKIGGRSENAYLVKKKIAKSVYGTVRLCIVLQRRNEVKQATEDDIFVDECSTDRIEWESTDQLVAIKASSWAKIYALRGKHLEDPIKEISAMQHIGNYHKHVLGIHEVLQDDEFLYTVMHYVPGGDLYGRLLGGSHTKSQPRSLHQEDSLGFDEDQAREWFRQLLLVRYHELSLVIVGMGKNHEKLMHFLYRGSFICKRRACATEIYQWRMFCLTRMIK
jgi:serine/threonine protein kinase